MVYREVIENLSNNLLQHFDEIWVNTEIITNDKAVKIPAVAPAKGDEWIDLSPSDQKEIIYIRRNGDDEVIEDLKIGSCAKSYRMRSNLRIVYFKDHANKHSEIIHKLMQSVLITGTKLKSVIRDKWKLQKDESSGAYTFGATTAYFAIEISALWNLLPDNCQEDFCLDIPNPLKKELCQSVVA